MLQSEIIAEVFLRPARTYSVMASAGRRLKFLSGHAEIHTDSELDYVLNMADASIQPRDRYKEHVANRIAARDDMHPTKAEIDDDGLCPASEYPDRLQTQRDHFVDSVDLIVREAARAAKEPAEGFVPYIVEWGEPSDFEAPKRGPGRPRKE